ncbi:MAG: hypothetical protein WBB96_08465 [Candidatus Dechloromonas phosphoritropha]
MNIRIPTRMVCWSAASRCAEPEQDHRCGRRGKSIKTRGVGNLFLLFVFLGPTTSIAKAEELRLTQAATIDLPANATAMAWLPTSKALLVGSQSKSALH